MGTESPASGYLVSTRLPRNTNARKHAAVAATDLPTVDEHAAREPREIEWSPIPDRLAENAPGIEEIVRDQRWRPSERELWWRSYSGHHGIDVGRDPVAGERGILKRDIAG